MVKMETWISLFQNRTLTVPYRTFLVKKKTLQ